MCVHVCECSDGTQTYLQHARVAVLRQLQRALLPVFALTADLLAALELEPQFSNLLRDGGTHKEKIQGKGRCQSLGMSWNLPTWGKVQRKLATTSRYKFVKKKRCI